MATPATDHFHHYTYGDTDEPNVSEQLEPLSVNIAELFSAVRNLTERVEALETIATGLASAIEALNERIEAAA
jgi:peptidoglycan hydrolase CwlO-like protein